MKLGKKPFVPDHRDLKFASYLQPGKLPTVPDTFGHDNLVKDWQMLGNDIIGDCAIASAYHLAMLWNAMSGKQINIQSKQAVNTYSKVTGFNPNDPSSDRGTCLRDMLKYWKNTGIEDADGKIHKIDGYAFVDPKHLPQLFTAMYLFGGVYAGILFPDSAMDQFNNGRPWQIIQGDLMPDEGHAIPLVGKRGDFIDCVTWGKEQAEETDFHLKYCDEAWIAFSKEMLIDNCNLEGFLWEDMLKDAALLK